jgi:ABC-2 type transport system ATP-binding protein
MTSDPQADTAVVFRALRKQYGKQWAVDGLDLAVPRGAVFGLLGPNGAGKSTSFGIACGWLRATSGSVEVLGVDSRRLYELGGRVAALPQDAHFPATMPIVESLAHYARLSGIPAARAVEAAHAALDQVGLAEAARKTGAQLSHGMHKRVGLAQALLGPPEVVFLDEPTSGLDPRTAHEMKRLIASLAPRTTVILSSHNLAEVEEICTHGAILDRGRLTVSGPIETLTRRAGELTIVVRAAGADVLARLARLPHVQEAIAPDAGTLRVRYDAGADAAVVLRACLEALFAADVAVLGAARGTSLERAFLELTSGDRTP